MTQFHYNLSRSTLKKVTMKVIVLIVNVVLVAVQATREVVEYPTNEAAPDATLCMWYLNNLRWQCEQCETDLTLRRVIENTMQGYVDLVYGLTFEYVKNQPAEITFQFIEFNGTMMETAGVLSTSTIVCKQDGTHLGLPVMEMQNANIYINARINFQYQQKNRDLLHYLLKKQIGHSMGMSVNNITQSIWNGDNVNDNGSFYNYPNLSEMDKRLFNQKYRFNGQKYLFD